MTDGITVTATRLPGNPVGDQNPWLFIPTGVSRRELRDVEDALNWVRAWNPPPSQPPPPETPPVAPPIAPQGPIDEVVVTGSPPPPSTMLPVSTSYSPLFGVVEGVTVLAPRPAPRPRPRPRPRRAPKKAPPKRRPDTRPKRGPRIVPQIVRFAKQLLRLGRVVAGVGGVLIPTDLNDGEGEFLDDYYGPVLIPPPDDDGNRATQPQSPPNPGRLPEPSGHAIPGITVTRPRIVEGSRPFVAPFDLAYPFALPNIGPQSYGTPGQAGRPYSPPERRPVNEPQLFPTPGPSPVEVPAPSPRPNPQTNPRTANPPRTPGAPLPFYTTPLIPGPGSLQLPIAQPVPQPEPNKDCCPCPGNKKKKKKKKNPRTECREGTYRQLSKGIVYNPKRKIPCR